MLAFHVELHVGQFDCDPSEDKPNIFCKLEEHNLAPPHWNCRSLFLPHPVNAGNTFPPWRYARSLTINVDPDSDFYVSATAFEDEDDGDSFEGLSPDYRGDFQVYKTENYHDLARPIEELLSKFTGLKPVAFSTSRYYSHPQKTGEKPERAKELCHKLLKPVLLASKATLKYLNLVRWTTYHTPPNLQRSSTKYAASYDVNILRPVVYPLSKEINMFWVSQDWYDIVAPLDEDDSIRTQRCHQLKRAYVFDDPEMSIARRALARE